MRASLALLTAALLTTRLSAADPVDYSRDIKPILTKYCIGCHGPEKQRSGLRLDSAKSLLAGGNSGSILIPGKGDASRLLHAVTGSNDVAIMPPKPPRLAEKEIALLKRWIDEGAKAPKEEVVQTGS